MNCSYVVSPCRPADCIMCMLWSGISDQMTKEKNTSVWTGETSSYAMLSAVVMSESETSPFLWNSIPFEILQITKSVPFRLALFVSLITVYIFVFCICFCSCHVLLYGLALVVFLSVTVCVCHCKLGSMFAGIAFYVTHVF